MARSKKKKKELTKAEKFATYKQAVKNRLSEVIDEFFVQLEEDYVRRIEIEVEEVSGNEVFFHCNLEPFEMQARAKEVKGLLPNGGDWKISVFGVERWEQVPKTDSYRKTVANKPERSKEKDGWWRYFAERRYGGKDEPSEGKDAPPAAETASEEEKKPPRRKKDLPTYPGTSFRKLLEGKTAEDKFYAEAEAKRNRGSGKK